MENTLRKTKIKIWKKQEEALQKKLITVMQKKGAAAQEGDLSENAAYQFAAEEAEVISVRLSLVRKMIQDLEKTGR